MKLSKVHFVNKRFYNKHTKRKLKIKLSVEDLGFCYPSNCYFERINRKAFYDPFPCSIRIPYICIRRYFDNRSCGKLDCYFKGKSGWSKIFKQLQK